MITYKQIEQIEKYLAEVEELQNKKCCDDESFFKASKGLDERMRASNIGYSSTLSWSCFYFEYSTGQTIYNVGTIKSNLMVMQAALEGILNSIPYYSEIVAIRKDIARGKKIVVNEEKQAFVMEMIATYQGKIDLGDDADVFAKSDFSFLWDIRYDSIYNGILSRMELYLNDIGKEKHSSTERVDKRPYITVNQNQNVNQTQSSNIDIDISMEDCFKNLDDCETLTPSDLEEIKEQINEIRNLLQNKKGKKKTIKEKIGSILKWLADRGTDVMIALLPYLIQVLQGL